MGRQVKLEIGSSFHDYEIRAWAKARGYSLIEMTGAMVVYNHEGQYTEFQYYDAMYTCTALWFRITNPRNPYYKPLPDDTDFREIYE